LGNASDIKTAFEALFRKMQPGLVRFAYIHLRDVEDAREVVQEVFINIWDKREQLNFEEELKYYLFRSVKNGCLNFIKKRRLDTVSLEEGLTAAEDARDDGQDTEQRFKAVMVQINQLPEMCREIFLMSRMEGLSHKEIAEILEIAPKTVENQIGIGLKKIREGLGVGG
jgi:RNA polymerase sigma-70 factor, ECF subfamily